MNRRDGAATSLRHPERVDGVILSNAPSDPVSELRPVLSPAMIAANARVKADAIEDRAYWQAYFEWLWGDKSRITEQLVDFYYYYNLRGPTLNTLGLLALSSNKEATMARLAGVKAPVLVIWGYAGPCVADLSG